MAKYRTIYCDFWENDKVFDDFTPEDKLFYIYLLTNKHTAQIGIYKIKKQIITSQLGYGWPTIENLIDRFENYHKMIKFNKDTREVCIIGWGKYNLKKSGKPMIDCVKKELNSVEDKSFIKEIIETSDGNINPEILGVIENYLTSLNEIKEDESKNLNNDSSTNTSTPTETDTSTYTSTNLSTTRGQNIKYKTKDNNKISLSQQSSDEEIFPEEILEESHEQSQEVPEEKHKFSEDSQEVKAAQYLFSFIKNNNPKTKEPDIQKWAKDINLILRIDNRDPVELKKIIEWCQTDSFWMCNILSPSKLRKQYDQLLLKMAKESSPQQKQSNKPSQSTNYEQRTYNDEFFEQFYENLR
jgi:hypothetical protein